MQSLNPISPTATRLAPDVPPAASVLGGPKMEIAHVLFMDVVGYSRLRTNQQAAAQIEMQSLVSASREVKQALAERKFICRPAGDGMALVFFRDIASPARTALEIHEEIRKNAAGIQTRVGAPLKMRMGIHSGTVLMVEDLNAQSDAAGDGINIAQRVMDCGDADHILVSGKVAESLLTVDPWQRFLRDLGNCRVKHGVMVRLYLLHGRLDGPYYGNVGIPSKVQQDQEALERESRRFRGSIFDRRPELKGRIATALVLAAIAGGTTYAWRKAPAFKKNVLIAYGTFTHQPPPAAPHGTKTVHHGGKTAPHSAGYPGTRSYDDVVYNAPVSRVLVPDLLGKGTDEASGIAENEGLHLARQVKSAYNTQYGEGLICNQTPAAGAYAVAGSRILIRLSKGDPPDPGMASGPNDSATGQ
jgi:class 3 adenylate cyclase